MNCGEEIQVKNIWGSVTLRFIAQCGGRFMQISDRGDIPNGYLLPDWHGALRQLVALTVPEKLTEKMMSAASTATGRYAHIPLTYPLSVKGLADVLGAPADEIRAQLEDLAVQVD